MPNNSGPLVYSATVAKPVRGAFVEVLDALSNQIAVTATDGSGNYSVSVPANSTVIVRVRAQIQTAAWDVSVRDNTGANTPLYSMQSAAFATGSVALTRDLRADSGWGGSSYTGRRVSAPFAVLDTVYTSMLKVLSVAPATTFPPLKVFWSPNNVPTSGSLALGQIGNTFFTNRSTGREIYVLGKENVDTDEFDAPVIAHEWGHYYQSSFSRDDSVGGSHDLSDRLDRRVAFSEGWGNGWSGIALGRSNYVDSRGEGQVATDVSVSVNLTVGPSTNPGWFRERSIHSIFWNLNQQVGFKPIHDAMTSAQFRGGAAVTSIHPFTAALNAVAPGSASALAGLLSAQNISAGGNDPFGEAETNDGNVPIARPMYGSATVGVPASACVTNVAGGGNKLGNYAYLRFVAPTTRDYQISVAAAAPVNPDFAVFRAGQIPRSGNKLSLPAGEYVLAVTDLNSSGANCISVSIQ
ncbi:hypothetical protein [Variovorax sp. UC122_21]|uniref:hypothetical protein n=1 Tax=Variovorax sp. UC122_21 TaxID=3374554 RepID=UPI0037583445